MGGAIGVALTLDADHGPVAGRVEKEIRRARAVTPGEHDDARAEREHSAEERLGFLLIHRRLAIIRQLTGKHAGLR